MMLPEKSIARALIESRIEITRTVTGRHEANVDCVPLLLNHLGELDDIQSILFDATSKLKGADNLVLLAAIPLGGVLLAEIIRDSFYFSTDFPIATVDTKRTQRILRGKHPSLGERVIMIDDVIGTGETMVRAINVMRLAGARVTDAIVLIDRGIGGKERLDNNGVTLHSVHELKVKP